MNQQQINSLLRSLFGTLGGIVIGWFASRGWHLTPDDQKNLVALLQSPELVGLAVSGLTGIMGLLVHTQANAVAVVAKIAADPASPVVGVITTNTSEGRALAQSLPAQVAPANTAGAASISLDSVPPLPPKAP